MLWKVLNLIEYCTYFYVGHLNILLLAVFLVRGSTMLQIMLCSFLGNNEFSSPRRPIVYNIVHCLYLFMFSFSLWKQDKDIQTVPTPKL